MRWKVVWNGEVWSYWRSMKWRCFGNKIDSDITRLGKRLKFSVFLNWDWLGEKVLWRQINFRRSTCIWRQCFKKLLANFANLANLNASTMLALIKILQKIALNLILTLSGIDDCGYTSESALRRVNSEVLSVFVPFWHHPRSEWKSHLKSNLFISYLTQSSNYPWSAIVPDCDLAFKRLLIKK